MKNDFYLVYIGYLTDFHKDPIVLAVSDNKADVKSYLENIRKLNKNHFYTLKSFSNDVFR